MPNRFGVFFLKVATLTLVLWTIHTGHIAAQQNTADAPISVKDINSVGIPPGFIRLSSNENPLGPSPRAVEAIGAWAWSINRYTWYEADSRGRVVIEDGKPKELDPETGLIKGLAKIHQVDLPETFAPDDDPHPYVLASGSGEILDLLSTAYLVQGGGEVIEAEASYGDISDRAEDFNMAGIATTIIRVPMKADHGIDLNAMRAAITPKTTLVVITNPNNPTGTLLSYEELERFVNSVPNHCVVVIDEAYIDFVDDPNYKSAIDLAKTRDNVVVVRTFSKVYGIRGVGLGYAFTSQSVKKKLDLYKNTAASELALIAGTAALRDDEHAQKVKQAVRDSKAVMYRAFEEMGLDYIPSQSCFVMVNVHRDSETVENEMWRNRVSIRGTSGRKLGWFDVMKGWVRVSAGTVAETKVFVQTLKEVMTGIN